MLRIKSEQIPGGACRWEDRDSQGPLASRLRFASGVIGMPNWRSEDATSHAPGPSVNRYRESAIGAALRAVFSALRSRIRSAAETRRGIQAMSRLDDHLLRDMGLHRGHIDQLRSGMVSLAEIGVGRHRRADVPGPGQMPISPVAVVGHAGSWECANDCAVQEAA